MRKLLAALAVAGLVAAGCGGDDGDDGDGDEETIQDEVTDDTSGDGEAGADAEGDLGIIISGSAFDPETLETEGGTVSVTVSNQDSFPHTFTTDDGSVDEEIGGGEEVTVDVEVDGEVAYHCEIHPTMTGTITG